MEDERFQMEAWAREAAKESRKSCNYCYLFAPMHVIAACSNLDTIVRVKIGKTENPCTRLEHLQRHNPEYSFAHVWYFINQGGAIEQTLHSHYASARIAGEYFEIPFREIAFLMSIPAVDLIGVNEQASAIFMKDWKERPAIPAYTNLKYQTVVNEKSRRLMTVRHAR
jgi:hypothetical protein